MVTILRKPNKEDYSSCQSYRPISLLLVFGKILEKVITRRMSFIAEVNEWTVPQQFGFRRAHAPADAILHLTESIKESFQKRRGLTGVTLDIVGA